MSDPRPSTSTGTGTPQDLTDRRVLVPGGTGAVGEGIVRAYLAAGAVVVVPTRTPERAEQFRGVLGAAATDRLHLVVHDYTTFAGAADLAAQMVASLGGVDDVVAPIGGWWAGGALAAIDETDWQDAFVGLATAHAAVMRACLPLLGGRGAYTVVVGDSASTPVPDSGLVSMEQAAVLMMTRVLAAEAAGRQRVFALVLGPVRTRLAAGAPNGGSADQVSADQVSADQVSAERVSADQVGAVAVAASAATTVTGRQIVVHDRAEVDRALALLAAAAPAGTGAADGVDTRSATA